MNETRHHRPPTPIALAFVACLDVFRDQRTNNVILIAPTSRVPIDRFPTAVRMALWAEFTGGHGVYHPRVCLLDSSESVVWDWDGHAPLETVNPLVPHDVTFYNAVVTVPRAGRYRLALYFNGEEMTSRSMWFGTDDDFRS